VFEITTALNSPAANSARLGCRCPPSMMPPGSSPWATCGRVTPRR
jgi:hypothetical protein